MKLLPDQMAFVRAVYGPKGRKRVRLAIKSAPRGSGKTGLVAGLVLAHLVGPESEPRGEIYSAAIDREQAALVFHEVEAIVHAVPEFEAVCNVVRHYKRVEVVEGPAAGSKYESLSADARRAHGLSPTLRRSPRRLAHSAGCSSSTAQRRCPRRSGGPSARIA